MSASSKHNSDHVCAHRICESYGMQMKRAYEDATPQAVGRNDMASQRLATAAVKCTEELGTPMNCIPTHAMDIAASTHERYRESASLEVFDRL